MKTPYIEARNANSDATTVFSGLDHELSCPDGQFYEMRNLSGDYYPMMATRAKRGATAYTGIYSMTPVEMLSGGEVIKCMACVTDDYTPSTFNGFDHLTLAKNCVYHKYIRITEKLLEENWVENPDITVRYTDANGSIRYNRAELYMDDETEEGLFYLEFEDDFFAHLDAGTELEIVDSGAHIAFLRADGSAVREKVYAGGTAEETRLIAQAGYLYAFPGAVRVSLMTDDLTVDRLGADVIIRNDTVTQDGSYLDDAALTMGITDVNPASLDPAKYKVKLYTDGSTWNSVREQWYTVYACGGVMERDGGSYTITGNIYNTRYIDGRNMTYQTEFDNICANVPGNLTKFLITTKAGNTALMKGAAAVGDRIIVTVSGSTAEFKIHKPAASPEVIMQMTPCTYDGFDLNTGFKAQMYISARKDMSDEDISRGTNQTILYTGTAGSELSTNQYGTEAKVDADGKVIAMRFYGDTTKLTFPEDGFILSGNGTGSAWIENNVEIGNFIPVDLDTFAPETDIVRVFKTINMSVETEKPSSPTNGMRWYDDTTNAMYIYSSASEQWVSQINNYVALTLVERNVVTTGGVTLTPTVTITNNGQVIESFNQPFKDGDSIKITGISEELDGSYIIDHITEDGVPILNANIFKTVTASIPQSAQVRIERIIPKMEYVIECGNRLWGCHYGPDSDGGVLNEIYASALGDPANWYKYQNTSMDSWTATIGAPGKWTGAVKYGDYPLFFKEDAIIRVFGTAPSSFQTACYRYRGIKDGSWRSAVIVNEMLYYHSLDGVLAYSGSQPQKTDKALGAEAYSNAAAGAVGGKLYISMEESDGGRVLFCHDTKINAWHEEDNLSVREMVEDSGRLYYVLTDGRVLNAFGGSEADFDWYAETGEYGYGEIYKKRLEKVRLRIKLPRGSKLITECSYDNGAWEDASVFVGGEDEIQNISFIPRRCERFRMRFSGKGECKIITVYRETTHGGDGR